MPVLHRPYSVTHSDVTISKVQDFSWSEQGSAMPSMGDADTYASAVIPGGIGCAVQATSTDVDPGITVLSEASTLTASFKVAQATTATITILNCTYLGGSKSVGAGEPNSTHAWLPRSADGTTTPISISNA